jgi:hypothetical protein
MSSTAPPSSVSFGPRLTPWFASRCSWTSPPMSSPPEELPIAETLPLKPPPPPSPSTHHWEWGSHHPTLPDHLPAVLRSWWWRPRRPGGRRRAARAHRLVTVHRVTAEHGPLLRLGWASRPKPWAVARLLLSTDFWFSFSFIFPEIHIKFKNA